MSRKKTTKSKMQISDEERERRSKAAKDLVTQGKLGGRQPGAGRPRVKRASEIVAEHASKKAKDIVGALDDALAENQPASVRLQAVKTYIEIENQSVKLSMEEERHIEDMQTSDLISYVESMITQLGYVRTNSEDEVIDAELVYDDQERITESS